MHPPPSAHCSLQRMESTQPLPRKAIPFFCSSSGSLGFSEACPQPAHTAWKRRWSNTSRYILHQHLPLVLASCLTPLLGGGDTHHPHSEHPFCSLCFPWGLSIINPSPCWHRSWAFWHQYGPKSHLNGPLSHQGGPAKKGEASEQLLPGLGSVWKCPRSAPRWRSCCCWPPQGRARSDQPF